MGCKNAYAVKLQQKKFEEQANRTVVHTRMCLDAAIIAANEVLQLGPKRVQRFQEAFSEALNEIATMSVEDAADLVYTKEKLDNRLKPILGEHFLPWDERYK